MKNYWDEYNAKFITNEIPQLEQRNNWVAKYSNILQGCNSPILELGCGQGNTTAFLVDYGREIIATDISTVAIKHTKKSYGNKTKITTMQVDLENKLPFSENSFQVIVADLCLHYFTTEVTTKIMNEIKRVLKPNGYLIARVNSSKDEYAQKGKYEIEPNYIMLKDIPMRFFTIEDTKKFFSMIGNAEITETIIICHYEKQAIETCVQKS